MVELLDSTTGRGRSISVPSRASVVVAGVNEDDLFVGLCNGTAVGVNVGSTATAALAALRATLQRFGTTHQFVGYRDAPMPASAPDDPTTTIVTRGEVTMHARIDADDEEHWRLTLSLPPDSEPIAAAPTPPPQPWLERAIANVRRFFAEASPPPAPSPTERTFTVRGTFAAPASAEAIDAWLAAFARAHSG